MKPLNSAHLPRVHCILLVALGCLAYHNSLFGPFIFDDTPWIVENSSLRRLWPPGNVFANNRPVLNLTLAVNFALGGTTVWGYHLVNVAIHIATALILYGLARRTLLCRQDSDVSLAVHSSWLAAIIAAIWLVHPLQTQSVTYTVQRGEALMGLFYLLCVYCCLRGVQAKRRIWWYLGAILCCWLGMGTKEVMATAPLVVLLYDLTFLSRRWTEPFKRRWALYVLLFASWSWLFTNAQPALASEASTAGFSGQVVSPAEYFLSQPAVLLHYVRLAFWPHPLCLDYYWTVNRDPASIVYSGLTVLGLFVASLWAVRYRPGIGFVAVSFFLVLAPTSSILPISDLAVEHRMYLPLAAVITLAALLGRVIYRRAGQRLDVSPTVRLRVVAGLSILVLSVLVWLTIARNEQYQSVRAIWASVLAVEPENPRAYNQLGIDLERAGKTPEAVACFREAVRLSDLADRKPLAEYHYNLAMNLHNQGAIREAILHYRRAIRLRPRSTRVLVDLGAAYSELGQFDDAIEQYAEATRVRPDYAPAHNNMALALVEQKKYSEALHHFELALNGKPKIPSIRSNLARTLVRMGREDEGVQVFLRFATDAARAGEFAQAAAILDHANTLLEGSGREDLQSRLAEKMLEYRQRS